MVNGLYKALKWIDKATPEQVAAAVPEQYHLGDKALYMKAVQASKDAYSKTGVMAPEGMAAVANMLKTLDKGMATANVDVAKTFNPAFVTKAAATVS